MPAGVYRRTLTPGAKVPHPVAITAKGMRPSSDQITDYVLCRECEARFDKGGENYALRLAATQTHFPFLKKLEGAPFRALGKELKGYAEADTSDVNRDALAYFSLSIFWRAAAHRWRWRDGQTVSIDLGSKYTEAIRRYLLAETGFPASMSLIVVAFTDQLTQDGFSMPVLNGRLPTGGWQHAFGARGFGFMLQIGKQLPVYSAMMSCMTPPERYIWTRNGEGLTMEKLLRFRVQHPDYRASMSSSRE